MSQRALSTVIEKTCDVCKVTEQVEMVGEKTPEELVVMTRWITLIREVYDLQVQKWERLSMQVCGGTCASLGAIKLQSVDPNVLETEQPDGEEIDIASLRKGEPIN